jgi:DNA modification methylase
VGYLLDMLEDSSILKVHCETHDDVILVSQGSSTRVVAEYADVIDMPYTDNKLHPTQKSVQALAPRVRSFTLPGELVLDPFAGSGSTCATAKLCGRQYLDIELDWAYFEQAIRRIERIREPSAP